MLKRDLLSSAQGEIRALPRFGIEVFLNERIIAGRLSIDVIRWERVTQTRKTRKLGWRKGIWSEFRMLCNIVSAGSLLQAITQTYRMRALQVAAE